MKFKHFVYFLLLSGSYSPLLVEFGQNLWAREHYQHFPFVVGAVAFLLYMRWGTQAFATQGCIRRRWLGKATLLISWLLLATAIWLHSPWLAAVSAVLLIGSFLLLTAAARSVPYLGAIWLLLWLIIPPPLNLDSQLIATLQRSGSLCSSHLLDNLGVNHLMQGNALLLPGKELLVDQACSGIVSVMSIIACAAIYGVWKNRAAVHIVLLLAAAVGWAMLANVVRITTIAYVFQHWESDWSVGVAHEVLGLALFLLAFLALMSTDVLLTGCLSEIEGAYQFATGGTPKFGSGLVTLFDAGVGIGSPQQLATEHLEETNSSHLSGNRSPLIGELPKNGILPIGWRSITLFSVLGIVNWAFVVESLGELPSRVVDVEQAKAVVEESFPVQYCGLERVGFEAIKRDRDNLLGEYSRTYTYRAGKANLVVSCDFPYPHKWHDVTLCYRGVGWEMTNVESVPRVPKAATPEWGYVTADFIRPENQEHGYVVHCFFNQHGEPVEPPRYDPWGRLLDALKPRRQRETEPELYQVQVWTAAAHTIAEDEKKIARRLLCEARERFKNLIVSSTEKE